ncbi:MAG: LysM peptidoglycan-binding domain-containing protein, partial [Pseudomonadota bacterium]
MRVTRDTWLTGPSLVCAIAMGLALLMPPDAAAQARIVCGQDYTVQPGDTLSIIARQAYGPNQFRKLHGFNIDRMGANPNLLEVGTVLRIPCDLDAPLSAVLSPAQPEFEFEPEPEEQPLPVAATQGTRTEIVFNRTSQPEFVLNRAVVDPYLVAIERASAGRIRFTDPAEPSRDMRAQLSLIQSGAIDAGYVFLGDLSESHPLLQLARLPLAAGSGSETATALWRVYRAYFAADGDKFDGARLLGFVAGPPSQIFVSDQVTSDADLLRVAGDALDPETMAEQGMALTYLAAQSLGIGQQTAAALEIDGGVSAPVYAILISEQKWAELPPDDRRLIEELSGEALAARSEAWDAAEAAAKRAMVAGGLTVIEPDLAIIAELQARARLDWERWIANADRSGVSGFDSI